jgi:surface polysaccharide O-acyltransferase-like enzyme
LAIFVVALHGHFLKDSFFLVNQLTENGIFRIAVPIFFIINGFYFFKILNNPAPWFKRVFILYSFWMIIYSYFWLDLNELFSLSISNQLKIIFFGYFHLWYLPAMIFAALLLWTLKKKSTLQMLFLSITFFIIGVLLQYFFNYFDTGNVSAKEGVYLYRNFIFFAVPFFFLGFLIHKTNFHKQVTLKAVIVTASLSTILLIIESYVNFTLLQGTKGFDILLLLIIVCPSLFLLFSKINISGKSKYYSSCASILYFTHPIIFSVLYKLTSFNGLEVIVYTVFISLVLTKVLILLKEKNRLVGLIF